MKALVLAGGFGTRLRPLSCSRPKTLFPLANQPLIDYTLQNLVKGGVDTVVLSVYYMAENIVRYLGPTKHDLGILYSREQRPLGKGGGIKYAEDMLNGQAFVVMNGDIVTDLDLRRLINYHKEKGGLATIALYQVRDPSRYGCVELDNEGRITRFVEKPEPGSAPSNLINAGIYILEPEVLEYMPPGKKFDTEEDVFPILAEEGKLFGFEFHGYWTDIGVPEEYLNANAKLLANQEKGSTNPNTNVDPSATIIKPCILGENVSIGAESVIGPNVSLSDNVHIGKGCRIQNSIIFSGATIEDYSSVRNAIIGENAVLAKWVKVESGSLIGDYAQIMDSVTITEGVSICPSTTIEESILQPKLVM
ncbi:MAG: NDP-sugar synthase [Candidatus Bathyarchaeota archaeon]|nr:NDP-sugar synthase [Candidatus Bathyarchaeota archaeon]